MTALANNPYILSAEQIAAAGVPGNWPFGLRDFARSTDIDDYQHVNNGAYFAWFENVRTLYMQQLGDAYNGGTFVKHAVRLANVDYAAPMYLHDDYVVVARTDKVGRSSFEMTLEAWSNGTMCCRTTVLMIVVDDAAKKSMQIPDGIRQAMIDRDGAKIK